MGLVKVDEQAVRSAVGELAESLLQTMDGAEDWDRIESVAWTISELAKAFTTPSRGAE